MALQVPYNVGDIINYFSSDWDENYDILVETVDPSVLDDRFSYVIGINIDNGERLKRILPSYLGRAGNAVVSKKA